MDFLIENGILRKYSGQARCVTLPEGITTIGEGVFRDCRELYEVNIPDGVTYIGDGAFQWCSGLAKVHAPESITGIGREFRRVAGGDPHRTLKEE